MKVVLYRDAKETIPDKDTLSGWALTQRFAWEHGACLRPQILRKTRIGAKYTLLKKACPSEQAQYYLLDQGTDTEAKISNATWADWDQRDRLVFAREGKLLAVEGSDSIEKAQELADFNSQQFTEVIAPEWAQHW
jgi:hypothetical protein